MKTIIKYAIAISVLFASLSVATAEPASRDSIKELMRLTGSADIAIQMMNQMRPALKQLAPDAPESFWNDFMAGVNADEIENLIIPVYQRHLSAEDVQALNSFYQTPVGAKLIRMQPVIMQDTMEIGQAWGQDLARQVMVKYSQLGTKSP